jgi:hypothetical protein
MPRLDVHAPAASAMLFLASTLVSSSLAVVYRSGTAHSTTKRQHAADGPPFTTPDALPLPQAARRRVRAPTVAISRPNLGAALVGTEVIKHQRFDSTGLQLLPLFRRRSGRSKTPA